ncbi:MAG TPA: DUF2510 domain-containing protein, partial [Acidimicrobiales bacterium]|nr:DUF2510 domain-containing protein [Acidimicrobiales bacterium]
MSDERNDQPGQSGAWQTPASSGPAAGWYPDPWDDRRRRYWDGQAWTGDVAIDPPGAWSGAPGGAAASGGWPPAAPAATGWGSGGGWGGPPVAPATPGWWGAPQGATPTRAPGGRVHVAIVALIAAIAVLAGIGI